MNDGSPIGWPKPHVGDRRYVFIWRDADALHASANANGWKGKNDRSPLDFAEPADYESCLTAPDFETAVKAATAIYHLDFFGGPRVYLQEFDPKQSAPGAEGWNHIRYWTIAADGTAIPGSD